MTSNDVPIIVNEDNCEEFGLPGISHRTVVGTDQDLESLEIWKQSFEPDSQTPPHYHECTEILLILEGSGKLVVGENDERFFSSSETVVVPPGIQHTLMTTDDSMTFYAVLDEVPARAFSPDGEVMELPWYSKQ